MIVERNGDSFEWAQIPNDVKILVVDVGESCRRSAKAHACNPIEGAVMVPVESPGRAISKRITNESGHPRSEVSRAPGIARSDFFVDPALDSSIAAEFGHPEIALEKAPLRAQDGAFIGAPDSAPSLARPSRTLLVRPYNNRGEQVESRGGLRQAEQHWKPLPLNPAPQHFAPPPTYHSGLNERFPSQHNHFGSGNRL